MKSQPKIVCFHLFNDFSGSPKVLRVVLQGLLDDGFDIDLYSSSTPGVLNKLNSSKGRLDFYKYKYSYSPHKIITLFRFAWTQIRLFFKALHYSKKDNLVFYINTLLPVGAALAGKMKGINVVYHYHENAYIKGKAYRFLSFLMQKLADDIICVSHYQRSFLKRENHVTVIPNALGLNLHRSLKPHIEKGYENKNILMLSSLKGYKGTDKFIEMAASMPEYNFTIVVNDEEQHIERYLKHYTLSNNITFYPRQNKVADFYNKASLVVNLSDKFRFVETFGLTALEAMTAALPIIVPTVGGIAEMVEDGVNGYKIDVQNLDKIESTIREVLSDRDLYFHLSNNALEFSKKYSAPFMVEAIKGILQS